jgi:hypothetical protein
LAFRREYCKWRIRISAYDLLISSRIPSFLS